MKTTILLLAAGSGKRFGKSKRDVVLAGKTLLRWNQELMGKLPFKHELIVITADARNAVKSGEKSGLRRSHAEGVTERKTTQEEILKRFLLEARISPFRSETKANSASPSGAEDSEPEISQKFLDEEIVSLLQNGGKTRHESVKIGLKKAKGDIVIIHNVANPMASVDDFVRIRKALIKHDAACFVGQKIQDTVRRVQDGQSTTIPREHLWRAQTPQGFRRKTLVDRLCHSERSAAGGEPRNPFPITDEIMLFESTKIPIFAFETSALNQKITVPEDLEVMERYLANDIRVGIGEDSHAFDSCGTLVLGGVKIADYPKLKANSDGDVVLHALCNALRSAMGQGSFSAIADPMCKKGIRDSKKYIQKIIKQTCREGRRVNNVAISIACQKPNIDPLVTKLKYSLSQILNVETHHIGIAATTYGGIGPYRDISHIKAVCSVTLFQYDMLMRRV